jgi:hypothetical protein
MSLSPPLLIRVLSCILLQTFLVDQSSIDQLREVPDVETTHHNPNVRIQTPLKLLRLLFLIWDEVDIIAFQEHNSLLD